MNNTLWKRFEKGLEDHMGDTDTANYKYAGGDACRHRKYYELVYGVEPQHEKANYCICGHHIRDNCYLCHIPTDTLVIVGNCCIKRFIPKDKQNRTCGKCGEPHRNRCKNLCNNCFPKCKRCRAKLVPSHSC
jgi:hypothetical protein